MRYLKIFLAMFLYLSFMGCSRGEEYQRSPLDIASDKVIAEIGKKVCDKYHMRMSGMGGGAPGGKLWILEAWFTRDGKKLNLEESRILVVSIVKEYLDAINQNEELRPFLKDYPFTADNLGIMVINQDENGDEVFDPYIGGMYAKEGRISYNTNDPDQRYKYKFQLREKYEEALVKLQQYQKKDDNL